MGSPLLFLLAAGAVAHAHAADRPVVAIIDSGVARVAELENVLIAEYDLAADPARPPFQPRFDHGTYVATVLHRAAKGGVDIVSLRIDHPYDCPEGVPAPCQPDAEPIASAIHKAVELGVDAINMSLNVKRDAAIEEAVRAAAAAGVRMVMAAGNQGSDRPANLAMAIAGHPATVLVGAVDPFGEPWEKSNKPDPRSGADYNFAWRPGVDIETLAADGSPVRASGTSLAAPMEAASLLVGSRSVALTEDVKAPAAGGAAPAPESPAVTNVLAVSGDDGALPRALDRLVHTILGVALTVALFAIASAAGRRHAIPAQV